jgi:hypothetical protein
MERRRDVCRAVLVAAFAVVAFVASVPATGQDAPQPLPLRVRGAVERSVALALQKLESDHCQAVFGDFRDSGGRTLRENLDVLGMSAVDHLRRLRWVDGAGHPLCRNPSILFVARVGQDEVRVCPRQFSAFATRQPVKAAGIIVHEQLHTLGLGENPPSSKAISRQVFFRCRL